MVLVYAKHTLLLDPFIKFHCHIDITLFWCVFQVPKCAKFKIFRGCTPRTPLGTYSAPQTPYLVGRGLIAPSQQHIPSVALSIPTFYSMAPTTKKTGAKRLIRTREVSRSCWRVKYGQKTSRSDMHPSQSRSQFVWFFPVPGPKISDLSSCWNSSKSHIIWFKLSTLRTTYDSLSMSSLSWVGFITLALEGNPLNHLIHCQRLNGDLCCWK